MNEEPGSRAVKLLMLSLDRDLAADIQAKNGATADDDSQLQVQVYATPDDAPVVFARFRDATLQQLEDVLRRMATVSVWASSISWARPGERRTRQALNGESRVQHWKCQEITYNEVDS